MQMDNCAPCRQPILVSKTVAFKLANFRYIIFFLQRYIQPERRKSCKPIIQYVRPNVPVESNTMYMYSYPTISASEAFHCRLPPAKPRINLCVSNMVKMDDKTVTAVRKTFFTMYVQTNVNITKLYQTDVVPGSLWHCETIANHTVSTDYVG